MSLRRLLVLAMIVLAIAGPGHAVAAGTISTLLNDTDLPGNDISSVPNISLKQCLQRCVSSSACGAFTFNTAAKACYLKSTAGAPAYFAGAESGSKNPKIVAATPPASLAPPPAAPTAPAPSKPAVPNLDADFPDIIAYCQAADTVDTIGKHYTGPAQPIPVKGQVALRCVQSRVLFCVKDSTTSCQKPGATSKQPLDAEGFARADWRSYSLDSSGQAAIAPAYAADGSLPDLSAPTVATTAPAATQPAVGGYPPALTADDIAFATTQEQQSPGSGATALLQRLQASYKAFQVVGWYFTCNGSDVIVQMTQPGLEGLMDAASVIDYLGYVDKGRQDYCKDLKPFAALYGIKYPTPALASVKFSLGDTIDAVAVHAASGWSVSNPYQTAESQRRQQQAVLDQSKAAQQAQLDAAVSEGQKKFQSFGTPAVVNFQSFASNPFLFQNQNVGLWVYLVQVIYPTEALFAGKDSYAVIDVKGINASDFTTPHAQLALSLHVDGTASIPSFGVIPSGTSNGYVFCAPENGNCGWLHN